MRLRKLENFIVSWTRWVEAHPRLVLLAYLPLLLLAGFLVFTRLGINTDLSEMISEDLEFHKRWIDYRAEFPKLNETFVLVIESENEQKAYEAANEITDKIKSSSNIFQSATWLTGGEFFEKNQFLFVSVEELQARLKELAANPSLQNPTGQSAVSFEEAPKQHFVEVKPILSYQDLLPTEKSYLALQDLIAEYKSEDLQIGITGTAALAFEEMRSVSDGAALSGILSLLLVAGILFWGVRSFPLIGLSLVTLIVGLILTAGFAAFSVGNLNMISVAFAVLFIGLGVDYSIHLALRYRELRAAGLENLKSLETTMSQIGSSLVLCTLTTSAGFFAFVPTAYAGVSELGLISGFGMIVNLFIHLTLFPAFFSLFPLRVSGTSAFSLSPGDQLSLLSFRYPRRVLGTCAVVFALALPGLFFIRFDANPLNLQNPNTEAFQVYRSLMESGETSPWSIKILADSREEEMELVNKLESLDSVSQVISLSQFIPANQKEKIQMLKPFGLSISEITEDNLVEEWRARFMGETGKRRIEVFPQEDLMGYDQMKRFSDDVLSVTPNATDDPITLILSGEAVVDAFAQAFLYATILIVGLILLMTFSVRDAFLVLVPMIFAGVFLKGVMTLFGMDFNFANIIVLPLLLGIGVDSGVHILHRFRSDQPEDAASGSTQRAVFFSSLTTIVSFGTLSLSSHPGTASMGVLLTIGTAVIMISTLMILPAVVSRQVSREPFREVA